MWNKITIQIVGWNSANDLMMAINGLQNADDNVIIRYIDNNSTDESVEMIKQYLPQADIIELSKNRGFAEANNIGIRKCDTEFIMLHNPDLTANLDGIKKILDVFKDERVGAVQGKLYRDENKTIDSAGVIMTLALNGRERGAGEVDQGQYDEKSEISAVTGAAGIYRLKALRDVAYTDLEVFDKDFFAYKEEVDLGWRLRNANWQCIYVPIIQGTHHRALRSYKLKEYILQPNLITSKLSDARTRYSLRNWVWMVIKNTTIKQAFKHEIFFDLRLACFILLSLIYWPIIGTWGEIIKGVPTMIKKRTNK